MSEYTATENLDGLIAKIRGEGVEEGRRRAAEEVRRAEEEARAIQSAAEAEASRLLQEARDRIQREEKVAHQALQRAARDTATALRVSLRRIVERLLRERCEALFDAEGLRTMVTGLATEWLRDGGARAIDVHVGPEDVVRLSDGLLKQLREALKGGVELKVREDLRHGFSISEAGCDMQVEFTAEAAAEALMAALHPRLAALFEEWRTEERDD
jgi:V/A-type H+-transporting ATPase subunit E